MDFEKIKILIEQINAEKYIDLTVKDLYGATIKINGCMIKFDSFKYYCIDELEFFSKFLPKIQYAESNPDRTGYITPNPENFSKILMEALNKGEKPTLKQRTSSFGRIKTTIKFKPQVYKKPLFNYQENISFLRLKRNKANFELDENSANLLKEFCEILKEANLEDTTLAIDAIEVVKKYISKKHLDLELKVNNTKKEKVNKV
jgi:hypothetical protein